MADQFIRKLTHDNEQFDQQWSTIFDQINDLFIECEEKKIDIPRYKVKALNALVDYVIAEAKTSVKPISTKFIFIDRVVGSCASDPRPSLIDLVRIVQRVLDLPNIFTEWYLAVIKAIHFEFELCRELVEKPSIDLIESILKSLQKHSFLNGQSDKESQSKWEDFLANHMFGWSMSVTNKLTTEETVSTMRPAFQQLFRYAVRLSSKSKVWLEVVESFQRSLPNLFDSSDDPADTLTVIECADSSISNAFLESMAKSYKNNVQQFKANFPQILTTIEQLLLKNRFRDARNFIDDTIEVHIHTAVDIDALLTMLIRVCPQVNDKHRNDFCHQIILSLSYPLKDVKCTKKLAIRFYDFILVILNLRAIDAPKSALHLLEKNEFYPWKDLAPRFDQLIQFCVAYETIDEDDSSRQLDDLENILRLIVERAKVYPMIIQATHNEAQRAVVRWSAPKPSPDGKIWPSHVYRMGKVIIQLIDRKQVTVDFCAQLIEALRKKMANNEEDSNLTMEDFYLAISSTLATYIVQLKSRTSGKLHQQLALFIQDALAQPLQRENGDASCEQQMAEDIWFVIGECLTNEADARPYQPCLKRIHSLACDENEEFFRWWWTFWTDANQKIPDTASNYVEEFLSDILDRQRLEAFQMLSTLYFKKPEPFHARLNDLINSLNTNDTSYAMSSAYLISIIIKEHPELLTSTQIDFFFTVIKTRPSNSHDLHYLFQILGYVATAQPHLFHKHRDQLLHYVVQQQQVPAFECLQQYFVASTIVSGETAANEYLTILIGLLKPNKKIKQDIRKQIFHACELIGIIHKSALVEKRSDLMAFQSETECRMLLDFIDGKKLSADNQEAINQARKEIAQVEKRVIKTDENVQNVSKVVRRQETKMVNLDTRVNTVGTQLNDMTERIDIHQREIERIDAKTLSYVPSEWGGQVCKLLNHRADNDWRLLGKRFGYSTSELRHWSLQSDPSMALLNEWFMTHKADEATYGLVKMLDAIGRQDVSSIIRKAVNAAGDLIPDDMPFEIKRLPPIFLSYQWGTQKAVSTLKGHLEEAGYACWMDIGQMGGGDKLFAKIDAGIRGAKVIICCMNSAYAESDNCLREVHLAISTGKPIIPLQMEKQKWPPEGALGPIMSEYLYIRFYDRKNNAADYWPADKFPELLGQIRYHVAPNLDMITPRYKDWFAPNVDNLIFLQPASLNSNTPLDVTHPHVMISYQWDRQTDIIDLYKRLTQLGYRCWLDIFQMGGGDSLFEKIDNGIRNAKCILACVTPNYTKSINCRREMSLSDALKKTIVPLLLEDTGTWPPAGPMALVFTDKSYIDLRRVTTNDIWSGKEFKEILAQLQQAVPEVQLGKPAGSVGVTTSSISRQNITSPSTPSSTACCLL